jgi:hypothetical protein
VVWNLLLQDGSEGPPLIDYSVTQKSRLSPPLLLMAHLEIQLHMQLNESRIRRRSVSPECGCISDVALQAAPNVPVEYVREIDGE